MKRLMTVGTRAVVHGHAVGTFRVVCATCEGGGTVAYSPYTKACKAATRDSARPCPCRPSCGAC